MNAIIFIFMTCLIGTSFFMSELNSNCPESNAEMVDSPVECMNTVTHFQENEKEIYFGGTIFDESFPKGCYVEESESSLKIQWNHHSFGSKNQNTRQICTQDGKNI